ncbi:MAG: hypothetical protein JSU59_05175 [Nitrospirota bacterium]|nr:MAG: hypothetical protein JSU59_05175 [Nitrospirota bacterium]
MSDNQSRYPNKKRLKGNTMNSMLFLAALILFFWPGQLAVSAQRQCPPTDSDAEGPFYKPDAPIRENTGRGLTVSGKVKSAGSCEVIPGARVEWW